MLGAESKTRSEA